MEIKISADFGSQMRAKVLEFESKAQIELSTNQRILLCEVGTVEQTLSLIVDSPITVKDIQQEVSGDWIIRSVWLCNEHGNKLIHAKTEYYLPNIPAEIKKAIEHMGIGSSLMHYDVDTRRRVVEFGYDKQGANRVWRRYEIWSSNKIMFDITESFDLHDKILSKA